MIGIGTWDGKFSFLISKRMMILYYHPFFVVHTYFLFKLMNTFFLCFDVICARSLSLLLPNIDIDDWIYQHKDNPLLSIFEYSYVDVINDDLVRQYCIFGCVTFAERL